MVTQTARLSTTKQEFASEVQWKRGVLKEYDITGDLVAMRESMARTAALAKRQSEIIRVSLPEAQEDLERYESTLMLEIAARKDENGKPVASNAETRKALLQIEMQESKAYQQLAEARQGYQQDLDNLNTTMELERKKYAAAGYAIEQKIAAMRFLAS